MARHCSSTWRLTHAAVTSATAVTVQGFIKHTRLTTLCSSRRLQSPSQPTIAAVAACVVPHASQQALCCCMQHGCHDWCCHVSCDCPDDAVVHHIHGGQDARQVGRLAARHQPDLNTVQHRQKPTQSGETIMVEQCAGLRPDKQDCHVVLRAEGKQPKCHMLMLICSAILQCKRMRAICVPVAVQHSLWISQFSKTSCCSHH